MDKANASQIGGNCEALREIYFNEYLKNCHKITAFQVHTVPVGRLDICDMVAIFIIGLNNDFCTKLIT